MKKNLIFYASYGGGHLSAAKSIKQYLDDNYQDVQTEIVDCMKYINKSVEKITTGAYREMAKSIPNLWGKIYNKSESGILGEISKEANKIMAIKLLKLIRQENPDLIISTHPFSSQIVSYLRKKNKIKANLATVLTDFDIHNQWLIGHEYTNFFFVSNEDMKNSIIKFGVPSEKIHVTGIPISNRFLEKYNKEDVYKLFDLDLNKEVILFFGGGEFGLGKERTVQIFESLILDIKDYQIIAIAGKNEKMKESFDEIVKINNVQSRVKVLGFTDKVPELMSISSAVVTKPGGLTTTESLSSGLPMIIINPIPGQEEENAEFLVNKGVAIWIKKDDNIDRAIFNLFNDKEKLKEMAKASKNLGNVYSTRDICVKLMEEAVVE